MNVLPEIASVAVSPEIAALFTRGRMLHHAGKFAEAEAYYRRILMAEPSNADALNLLGVIAHQMGRHAVAIKMIRAAIRHSGENAGYFSNLGNVLYACGKIDEAVTAHLKAISIKPDCAEAYANLGSALKDQGKVEEAVAAYRQAICIRPDFVEAHNNLGVALNKQSRRDEAIAVYHQVISIRPHDARAFYNLGTTLAEQGKRDDAVAAYSRAIRIKPDFAEAHFNLGVAWKGNGKLDAAVAAYGAAIGIRPDFAEAYSNLAGALNELGRHDEAIAAYRRAISIRPSDAQALYNLGLALGEQGRLDEAIVAYRQAVGIKPDFTDARCNIGMALKEQGKLDEARALLEGTLEFAPWSAITYRALSYVKKFCANDPHLAAMEKLARDIESLTPEEQIDLHFALAKAYEDLGERERSFRHLLQGNGLKRKRVVYNEQATFTQFERIRSLFTPLLLHDKLGEGDPSSVPVFIIGMPRSGKTTVERILARHPKFHGAGELDEFRRAAMSLSRSQSSGAPASFPELVPALSGDQLRQLGATYVNAIRPAARGAERIGNTMPANFRFIGLIHLALPNARIIHMRRDPVEVCRSCFATLFRRNNHPYSYDLSELGRHYRAYETMMTHWRRILPADVMLEVRLEEVVADTERKTRELTAHCGLEWDEACLATANTIEINQLEWWPYKDLLQPLIRELGLESQTSANEPDSKAAPRAHAVQEEH
jgi:tetratricopeptide (TPR) repeat protein